MANKIDTPISDLFIIEPNIFDDNRGFFFESYSMEKYAGLGLNEVFVQDNISKSVYGTLRGLHYQTGEFAQGKLCQVIVGSVFDVALDIRFGSPTFGKYFGIELSDSNHKQLWIPPGFAHGFSVLSEEAVFHYKCTNCYNKESERSILFNDPDLAIEWNIEDPIISDKDLMGTKFSDIKKDFIY